MMRGGRIVLCLWLCVIVGVVNVASVVQASDGDTSYDFRRCSKKCVSHICPLHEEHLDNFEAFEMAVADLDLLDEASTPEFTVSWPLWTCPDNCDYVCMHAITDEQEANDMPVDKYFGKWPFWRVCGIQEVASTLFSIGNFLPNLYYFFHFHTNLHRSYPFRSILIMMTVIGMNTWIWSTAFHARDVYWTERADYYGAIGNVFSVLVVAITVSRREFDIEKQKTIATAVLGTAFIHIAYMEFVEFDYGFNMCVLAVCIVLQALLWFMWAWKLDTEGYQTYGWKMVLFQVLIIPAGLLELFDFPPYGRFIDAHAVWHLVSIPLYGLYYHFFVSDSVHLHRKKQHYI